MTEQQMIDSYVQVLAFDCQYKLCAIFRSISEASTISGIIRQSIIKAVYGETISAKGRYWRAVPKDMEIEPDDLGILSLFDFDQMCGVDRKIYGSRDMRKSSAMLESEYLNQ